MHYRTLGKTGLQVSAVGFGAWAIGGNAFGNSYGSTDDAVSLAALNQAYEMGCTFFDTSDLYGHGHSEALIGQALKGWNREQIILATKGGHDFTGQAVKQNFSEAHLRRSVEGSLRRLGVETIDLYQLQSAPLELIQHAGVFEVLRALKQEGKIRFVGVSIQDPQEGIQAIRLGQVDAVQAIYNLFDKRIEKQLVATCAETNTALIAREPLARGFLSGTMPPDITFEKGDVRAVWPRPLIAKRLQAADRFKPLLPETYTSLAQLAIAYPLANPAVSTVIPGCKTPAQADENFTVADYPSLTPDTLEAIGRIQDSL